MRFHEPLEYANNNNNNNYINQVDSSSIRSNSYIGNSELSDNANGNGNQLKTPSSNERYRDKSVLNANLLNENRYFNTSVDPCESIDYIYGSQRIFKSRETLDSNCVVNRNHNSHDYCAVINSIDEYSPEIDELINRGNLCKRNFESNFNHFVENKFGDSLKKKGKKTKIISKMYSSLRSFN